MYYTIFAVLEVVTASSKVTVVNSSSLSMSNSTTTTVSSNLTFKETTPYSGTISSKDTMKDTMKLTLYSTETTSSIPRDKIVASSGSNSSTTITVAASMSTVVVIIVIACIVFVINRHRGSGMTVTKEAFLPGEKSKKNYWEFRRDHLQLVQGLGKVVCWHLCI